MKGALLLAGAGALLSLLVFRGVAPTRIVASLEAQRTVYSWDPAKVRARLGGGLLVVDGRTGGRGARPKDAYRVALGGRTRSIPPPPGREVDAVLVVMESSRSAEARELAQRLAREWALDEVATLKGGFEAWIAAGLPLQ